MNNQTSTAFRIGDAFVEPMRNRITIGRSSRKVTSREMDVLMHLVHSELSVASREAVMESVWKEVVVNDDALTLAVSRLRRAFADDPRKPRYIETIPTRGYRLLADARPVNGKRSKGVTVQTRYKIGIAVLLLFLALMTSLFLRVRTEYGKVSDQQAAATTISSPVVE